MPHLRALRSGTLALLGALALAAPAAADDLSFDFVYLGDGGTTIGTLTTQDSPAGGPFLVTAITGTRNGDPITGLLDLGTINGNDNLFDPTPSFLTDVGIAFALGDFSYAIFLLSSTTPGCVGVPEIPGASAERVAPDALRCFDGPSIPVDLTLAVPGPASALPLGAGLLGLGLGRRLRAG